MSGPAPTALTVTTSFEGQAVVGRAGSTLSSAKDAPAYVLSNQRGTCRKAPLEDFIESRVDVHTGPRTRVG